MVAPPTSTTTRSPTSLGEPLGGDEHRPRRRQDLAVHDLPDALHAGRVRDVLLERIVDDVPGRDDVELVHRRIDVVGELDPEAGPLQQLLRVAADHGVAGVHDDGPRLELGQLPGVEEDGVAVAALHPAGQQDQIGLHRVDLAQVMGAQAAGGLVLDHGAGPQRGLPRGHRRHPLREAVDGHAQAAGGRAGRQRQLGQDRASHGRLQLRPGGVDADGDVAVVHRRGGDALPDQAGRRLRVARQPGERRDDRRGRADLGDERVDGQPLHVTSRVRAWP